MDPAEVRTFPHLSVWSLSNLQIFLLDDSKTDMKKLSIANPFKPYDLLQEGLERGIEDMVIQDLD